jgi:cytochrome c-type biogenesis protein
MISWLALGYAFWLGILTAISPCPMTTNIAAISFIGRQVGNRRAVLASGLLYTLGRSLTYIILGVLIAGGLLAAAEGSRFLQKYMNQMLGPVMIMLGLILLGWIGSGLSLSLAGTDVQQRAARGGLIWSGLLGILFALSFCPVSAGLFFAGLIPLSIQHESKLLLPAVYGLGTALPVIFFAFLIAFSSEAVGRAFHRLTQIEKWVRITAGALFILAGIYYCLTHIYGISIPLSR